LAEFICVIALSFRLPTEYIEINCVFKGMSAMTLQRQINREIGRMVRQLSSMQCADGSWRFCAENSLMTDAYMIILLRALEYSEEHLIARLTNRLLLKQEKNGSWKLYHDEDGGNLSATIEAYFALLYSGRLPGDDPRLARADQFIRSRGGLSEAAPMTKVMLALNGFRLTCSVYQAMPAFIWLLS
jgi:sporulenol synthase